MEMNTRLNGKWRKSSFLFLSYPCKKHGRKEGKKIEVGMLVQRARKKKVQSMNSYGGGRMAGFPHSGHLYGALLSNNGMVIYFISSPLHRWSEPLCLAVGMVSWVKCLENGNLKYLVKTMTFQSQTVQTTTISSRNSHTNNTNPQAVSGRGCSDRKHQI